MDAAISKSHGVGRGAPLQSWTTIEGDLFHIHGTFDCDVIGIAPRGA
jgi:hypothetical protein